MFHLSGFYSPSYWPVTLRRLSEAKKILLQFKVQDYGLGCRVSDLEFISSRI